MASAVANPTGSLQTALGEFQSILSDEDRKRLQRIKNKPEADAAIQFTATLDQENAAQRKGPSISSRLYSVLLCVQQFSNVVDTFVSANPSIAALVWGTVKLTMLIVTNFLTYYEKTSEAFLDFGRWSPRFSQYQSLFPTSTRLQAAICEFHASIIRCCKQIVCMSQRSWKIHLVNSVTKSFQSELENHIRLMKDAAREVSFEVQLAKAQSDVGEQQLQRQERTLALSHRLALTSFISKSNDEISDAQQWRAIVDRRSKAESDQRRLDQISTFDHVTTFNQARSKRYHSTGGWVFQTVEWRDWKDKDGSSVCWLSGKIGSGKTVLSATITDHLLASRRVSDSISFFFPRFDYADSLLAGSIIRSLIRQNLQPDLVDKLSDDLSKAYNSCYSQDTMMDLLVSKTAIFSTNYLLIDSLDECEPKERQRILQLLSATIKKSLSKVKILIASRDALENEITDSFAQVTRLRMNAPEAASDLELFAHQTLSERMNMGQLPIGNVVSFEAICDAITSRAQGMFLWVALEIDDICSQVCEEDVLVALQNLPTTLTEILTRAVLRILTQGNQRIAKEVFKWVSVAKRPLLLDELQDALSIKIGESDSRPERRPKRIEKLSAWCANLVEIDEVSNSVQFVHHSVRTFILDTSIVDPQFPKLNEFHNHVDDLDTTVGELCVTYLEWNDFKRDLQRSLPQSATTTTFPEPQQIVKTALAAEWQSKSAATIGRLIPQYPRRDIQLKLYPNFVSPSDGQNQGPRENVSHFHSYPFLEYAKKYWIMHTRMLTTVSSIYWPWRRMIAGTHHVARTEWTPSEYLSADMSILAWAQTHRHFALFHGLMSAGCLDFDRFHENLYKIVEESQSLKVAQISLESIVEFTPPHWTSDMMIRMEMAIILAYLLSHAHIGVFRKPPDWFTPKLYRPEILLLDTKLIIDDIADFPSLLEITYFTSVQFGFPELMTVLLIREAKLCGVPDCVDMQPLQVAIMAENVTAVDLLLQRGADPNQSCLRHDYHSTTGYAFQFNSLLHLATSRNNTTIMHLLISHGGYVNFAKLSEGFQLAQQDYSPKSNNQYSFVDTPEGRIRMINEVLVEFEIVDEEPNEVLLAKVGLSKGYILPTKDELASRFTVPHAELTPLHCAILVSVNNMANVLDLEPMKLLLSYGADSNVSTSKGWTPIFLAVRQRQPETFEVLLEAGADPTMTCINGQTAEEYAVQIGFHEAAKLIRKHHAIRRTPGPPRNVQRRRDDRVEYTIFPH
ncbi:hypothetical protein F4824DRAFT_501852 [Ustulina deusta]|nr:hypothetical protein F4824DRAFT_501852 [Ustulina deusta]